MFDYYEPDPPLHCPVCGTLLHEWQGTEGPRVLFVWRQGAAAPVRQEVPEESRAEEVARAASRLPQEFIIYSTDCPCPYLVEAIGHTEESVWERTEVVTAENVERYREWYKHWRRADFNEWLHWLSSPAVRGV